MRNTPLFILICLLLPAWQSAQSVDRSVVAQAGGTAATPTIVLEWTLGELATATDATTGDLWLTEGFHQPTLEVRPLAVADAAVEVTVFPNPFLRELIVSRPASDDRSLRYRLSDATGRRVVAATRLADGDRVRLSLPALASGAYVLTLLDADGTAVGQYRLIRY